MNAEIERKVKKARKSAEAASAIVKAALASKDDALMRLMSYLTSQRDPDKCDELVRHYINQLGDNLIREAHYASAKSKLTPEEMDALMGYSSCP